MYRGSPAPHGGKMTARLVSSSDNQKLKSLAAKMPGLVLSSRAQADLELLGVGGYSPLTGFMGKKDYESTVEKMRLSNGMVWSIPVVLGVSEKEAEALKEGSDVALWD